MAVFIQRMDIFFYLVKMSSFHKFSVECLRGEHVLFLWTNVNILAHCGSKLMIRFSLYCEIFIWVQDWKVFIERIFMNCHRTVFEN